MRWRVGVGVALVVASAFVLALLAARVDWRDPWHPRERQTFEGAAFLAVGGQGRELDGHLHVDAPGPENTAVQTLATAGFEAAAFPLLRYRFDGLPPTLALSFAFRRTDAPDQLHVVELPWPGSGSGSFDLRALPEWHGAIEEIGFAEFPTPQMTPPDRGFAPFALVGAELWSPSWRGSLAALGTAWFDPWPWTIRSVHALGRDVAGFRQWPLTVASAAFAGLAALWWALLVPGARRRFLPALAIALAAGWLLLDLVWAAGLQWRHAAADAVYGALDGEQRTRQVTDRDLVEVARQVQWLLRNEPVDTPVLIHARSGYPLYRLVWHLLPRNAFVLSQAMEAAGPRQARLPLYAAGFDTPAPLLQGEVLRPGSVVVFYDMPNWRYDAARGAVASTDAVLPADLLLQRDRLLVVRYRGLR
ncbi:hypothetical protein [Dokdonella koreensis]|uniref:Uncharacterized protein n=1 Tax=Dokdonella koreensis DS-123 TaxID=1300342 RepID=A0A160DXD0_9GAMM|nr:hypothetical protein [Dokdonella koreensis]ANB19174.1 Hypothetical protein I596_3184 [Dokdonella koreensis DS-123]